MVWLNVMWNYTLNLYKNIGKSRNNGKSYEVKGEKKIYYRENKVVELVENNLVINNSKRI